MDLRDLLRPLPGGAACTACGAPVPTGRIRILARRDLAAWHGDVVGWLDALDSRGRESVVGR